MKVQESGRTHWGRDVDKEWVAVDTHCLQEGVASNLSLGPLPPRQEAPQTDRHQPGVHEDDYSSYRYCEHKRPQVWIQRWNHVRFGQEKKHVVS